MGATAKAEDVSSRGCWDKISTFLAYILTCFPLGNRIASVCAKLNWVSR